MSTTDRIAGAPISWGVCEVPGWGHQLPPEVVLAEMRDLGITATELGPVGYLPSEPDALAAVLAEHGLSAVGGFVPLVLHRADVDPMAELDRLLPGFLATRAEVMVLAAETGEAGYDSRPELDRDAWSTLLTNLDKVAAACAEHGVRAVLHPHVGTIVERRREVERVLDGSSIPLCLDTGHLLIGGTDPVALARQVPDRIAHVHMKDVDETMADVVRAGEVAYTDAVRAGLYRPLGQGDVDVATIARELATHGYDGWYVLEQDTVLTAPPEGEGPVADVRASAEHLREVLASV